MARVGRAHGIRGEVSLELRTDEPDRRFASGAVVSLRRERRGPPPPYDALTVTAARWHQDRLLVRFAEVPDRTSAEQLRGLLLTAPPSAHRPDDPEEFYDHQLVGLQVVTTTGTTSGSVVEVLHTGAQDVLVVRLEDAGTRQGGGEVLVPFVTALVPSVDLEAGTLTVADRPGLLDPDQAE